MKTVAKLRRTVGVLVMLLLIGCLSLSALANDQKVVDHADLLSTSEENKLQEQFKKIADTYQCDVVVLTNDSVGTNDFQGYTKNFYLKNGYGYGKDRTGIILMVTMAERKFQLTTTGDAERIFTNYGLDVIDEEITEYLSDGEYYDAFRHFGDMAETFLIEARDNTPFDYGNKYHVLMPVGQRVLISLGAGLIVMIIVLLILRGQLKSVGIEKRAQEYVRNGSFHVTRSKDVYLYRTVSRRKIEKNSSSGSSGRSSGGHTGSF